MDKWIGKVVTIRSIYNNDVRVEEDTEENDGGGWYWNVDDFEYP